MSHSALDNYGKLLLRLMVGVLLLMHGITKLRYGVDGIGGMLAGAGLNGVLMWEKL